MIKAAQVKHRLEKNLIILHPDGAQGTRQDEVG
jgi:hypothetical protein